MRQRFCDFEIAILAKSKVTEILEKPNVIKNRKKIEAIINNAREFKIIKNEYGSFQNFLKTLKHMRDQNLPIWANTPPNIFYIA